MPFFELRFLLIVVSMIGFEFAYGITHLRAMVVHALSLRIETN